ncbi:MAG TPA: hypothetical protein VG898_02705 [Solirubrobacterales bacterium]|nr:hypothetical protein [Solirubrobacterales bacterium]
MSRGRSRRAGQRRLALAVLSLGLAVLIALIAATRGSGAAAGEGEPAPLPLLGVADPEALLIGSSSGGEAWAYRQLPLAVGTVDAGSGRLAFGPQPSSPSPTKQLAFLRYAGAGGWQVFQTPLDENGNPYRGPVPNRLSARITPAGGGVLVGRDLQKQAGEQVVVLDHDPGGPWRALPAPPPGVLLPPEGEAPGEALAAENGIGAVADAAFDESGHTAIFLAPKGRSVEGAVIHWDGSDWTREPVEVPAGSEAKFHILAIAASGAANAWAIAEAAEALGRSFVLLQRTGSGASAKWVERGLGAAQFADASTPAEGIEGLAPLSGAAQPLSVTQDGVWVDLSGTIEGAQRDLTIYYDISAGRVTGAWCDASLCESGGGLAGGQLGVRLSRQLGYRSFAWPGGEFGTRIVTNPLDPGGSEESNRGTYLRFAEGQFTRMPGGGGNFRATGAFSSVDEGWLQGPVEISAKRAPSLLRPWPIPLRAPLTAIAGAPGSPLGALGSAALAVGADGAVARYAPGRGWQREYLTSSSGAVNKATLRGVAWPEPGHAYAVGDRGAMWQWNANDDLWIADPGVPIGFEGNLMGIAFDPADPSRGYAVGKGGVLLGYGKSWEQEALPPGFAGANLTSIAFAGSAAIVAAGGDLLVNEGGGWHVDASAHALLDSVRSGNPQLYAVAGLADGGAVAAGRDIVIERDSATSPWRFSRQPILGSTAIAAAAVRDGGSVRAVLSVVPQVAYPTADDLPPPDPNVPPPIVPPFGLPGDGYLLRETASGWEDEERTAFAGAGPDRPVKTDPTLALLLEPSGEGWAVGGWSGSSDAAGRGVSASGGGANAVRARVRTATISRFGPNAAAAPIGATPQPLPMPAGPVRFAVAGNAQCEEACADLAPESLGPDRTLSAALGLIARTRGGWGPRALLYTGNRVGTGLGPTDGARYAALLGSAPGLPVFPALGSNDLGDGSGAGAFEQSFAGFPAPLGAGAAPAGISTTGIPGAAPGPGARTHYAFDSSGAGGTVRVVAIDNSAGSLAASDPFQNPPEAQLPWLEAVLADARAKGIPAIVMGNRSLNTSFTPKLNVASDGGEVARALVAGGASAYVFDRPEENRAMRIPAGAAETIPSFGSGTLGYRSQLSGVVGGEAADSLFGDAGVMVLELAANERDPATNRAPVRVRLIPVIQDLSLEAIDGTLLRRSIPALFSGLGRRPLGGDRWGTSSAGGIPNPSGGDPYTQFPPGQCLIAGCASRMAPEYSFTSSDPDIADFVKQDPNSTNLRKPFLDAKGKAVTDNSSALLCPFNAGTTTVTVSAGGYSYSLPLTVQDGSVQRPCGTRPLRPDRFKRNTAAASPPPPPPPPASPGPAPAGFPPPSPPPAPPPPPPLPNPVQIVPPPVLPAAFIPLAAGAIAAVPAAILPPPPPVVRPLPPGGAPARTYQVEERREEEAAIEESQAFSRHRPGGEGSTVPPYLLALVLLAALGGASLRGGPGARRRPRPSPAQIRR